MEVGTEQYPYTSQITFTLHGNEYDPYIPIYGNKVIGVRHGVLDMHGVKREPTWTVLDSTAQKGSSQITLIRGVDWQVGEQIGIATTNFDQHASEKRIIKAIDRSNPNKPVITLDKPLEHLHYAATETYGTKTIEMRAEVGLLTRNVKLRGDPETTSIN